MYIYPKIKIIDLSLYLEDYQTLIIGDVHLGFEESLNVKGVLIPRFHFEDLKERLKKILSSVSVQRIVLNGDLKHEFGTILLSEWKHSLQLIDFLKKYVDEIILLEGNHDKILEPLARRRNLDLLEEYSLGDIFICHGDFIPESVSFTKSKFVIIGHEHPAITLKHGRKSETYKCFLKGGWKDKTLVVMPSFLLMRPGTNVLEKEFLSPFLKQGVQNFNVYVVGEVEVLDFGEVKNL